MSEAATSTDLKRKLAHHLYWRLNYPIVCDEFEFIDLIGIRRSEYAVEFEIKVSKSDFNREIKCITAEQDKVIQYGKDWEKFSKHRIYLTGERPKTNYDLRLQGLGIESHNLPFRPSEFYFYVPDFLGEYATKKLAELGLPYGVIVCDHTQTNGWVDPYFVMKKATKLHSEKVNDGLYKKLAHALTIRSRVLN